MEIPYLMWTFKPQLLLILWMAMDCNAIRCRDCTGDCANPGYCTSSNKCFVRRDVNNITYKGCADTKRWKEGLDLIYNGCRTQEYLGWSGRKPIWCLCDTDDCNNLSIDSLQKLYGDIGQNNGVRSAILGVGFLQSAKRNANRNGQSTSSNTQPGQSSAGVIPSVPNTNARSITKSIGTSIQSKDITDEVVKDGDMPFQLPVVLAPKGVNPAQSPDPSKGSFAEDETRDLPEARGFSGLDNVPKFTPNMVPVSTESPMRPAPPPGFARKSILENVFSRHRPPSESNHDTERNNRNSHNEHNNRDHERELDQTRNGENRHRGNDREFGHIYENRNSDGDRRHHRNRNSDGNRRRSDNRNRGRPREKNERNHRDHGMFDVRRGQNQENMGPYPGPSQHQQRRPTTFQENRGMPPEFDANQPSLSDPRQHLNQGYERWRLFLLSRPDITRTFQIDHSALESPQAFSDLNRFSYQNQMENSGRPTNQEYVPEAPTDPTAVFTDENMGSGNNFMIPRILGMDLPPYIRDLVAHKLTQAPHTPLQRHPSNHNHQNIHVLPSNSRNVGANTNSNSQKQGIPNEVGGSTVDHADSQSTFSKKAPVLEPSPSNKAKDDKTVKTGDSKETDLTAATKDSKNEYTDSRNNTDFNSENTKDDEPSDVPHFTPGPARTVIRRVVSTTPPPIKKRTTHFGGVISKRGELNSGAVLQGSSRRIDGESYSDEDPNNTTPVILTPIPNFGLNNTLLGSNQIGYGVTHFHEGDFQQLTTETTTVPVYYKAPSQEGDNPSTTVKPLETDIPHQKEKHGGKEVNIKDSRQTKLYHPHEDRHDCPSGFKGPTHLKSCYRMYRMKLPQPMAKIYCSKRHAHLVSIESKEEHLYLLDELKKHTRLHEGWQGWWTDGKFDPTIREFVWSSTGFVISRLDEKWLDSILIPPYQQTCVWLAPLAGLLFGNYGCNQGSGFICEYDM